MDEQQVWVFIYSLAALCAVIIIGSLFKKKKIKLPYWSWPILQLDITIPYVKIVTMVWCEHVDTRYREYVKIYIQVFKWKFNCKLYKNYERLQCDKHYRELFRNLNQEQL